MPTPVPVAVGEPGPSYPMPWQIYEWLLAHGLPYFVAEERAAARAGLRPRRLVPILLLLVTVAAAAGGLLGGLSEQYTAAPALWLSVTVLGLLWYAATALHARPPTGPS